VQIDSQADTLYFSLSGQDPIEWSVGVIFASLRSAKEVFLMRAEKIFAKRKSFQRALKNNISPPKAEIEISIKPWWPTSDFTI